MSTEVVVASGGLDCHLMSGCGFPAPGAEIFQFDAVFTFTIGTLEFQITKITLLLLLCVILILAFFSSAFRKPKLVPRGAQNVGEMGYLFIRDGIARDTIGKDGDKYVPFLFSFFFLVWLSNFMGIVPFAQIPVTSIFAIPVAFALIVYLTWVPVASYKQGVFGFFKNMMFPPGVPKAMYVLLAPLEFMSNMAVLIAGCGTGQQSTQMALTFPDSAILAFDLSRASLHRKSHVPSLFPHPHGHAFLLATRCRWLTARRASDTAFAPRNPRICS